MYNNSKCNCSCGNTMGARCGNPAMNVGCPAPIVAPKKVCLSQSNRYVEQPVICPIECRHVQNLVYYPRYYPRYEQTYVTRDQNGNIVSAAGANASMYGGAASTFGANGMGTGNTAAYGANYGNSFKNGCGC